MDELDPERDDTSAQILAGLSDALVRAADDPVEFEHLVATLIRAAGEAEILEDKRFEKMVRESLPTFATASRARQIAIAGYFEAMTGPAIAIEETGVIVYANEAAQIALNIQGAEGLVALGVDRSSLARFQKRLGENVGTGTLLVAEQDSGALPGVWWGRHLPAYGVIGLTPLDPEWPAALPEILVAEFGLTPREVNVLASLSKGRSIEAIASRDNKAVTTIRQSVKSVLGKLGVNSQGQAIALVSAMSAAVGSTGTRVAAADDRQTVASYDRYGRQVVRRRYGVREGIPVLLIHGTLFGIGELAAERRLARELGFDVLACDRPGYGQSLPCKVRSEIISTAVDDMIATLDEVGISRAIVLAHDTGFAFAGALAVQAPERVAGIVAVSPVVPMRAEAQRLNMPMQQQIFAWASHRAPWLVDALTRIGVERMRRLGPAGWPHAVFAGADHDKAVASRPDILEAVSAAYMFNSSQSALGFVHDVRVANSDWSSLANDLQCPIHLIHGTENKTVPIAAVEHFAARDNRIVLEKIAGEGHTLALAAPELGLRAAFAMAVREGLA